MIPRKLCVCFKNVFLFVATFICVTVAVKQWLNIQKVFDQEIKRIVADKNIVTLPRYHIANFPKQKLRRFNLDQDIFAKDKRLYPDGKNEIKEIRKLGTNSPDTINKSIGSTRWQNVDSSNELFVFSAFFYEPENMVRVVGIGLRNKQFYVKCVFKYEDGENGNGTVWGNVTEIGEHHEKRYTALFVLCPLPIDSPRPSIVLIKNATSDLEPHKTILIRYNDKLIESSNISVCIPPLHSGYNKINELIQSIEMNQILGARKIFIYNEKISSSAQHVLDYYQRTGIVEFVDWNTPVGDKLIHYHGQMAFIHDCWLRNRGLFKFVVFNDLDELIIPYKHKDWIQMLSAHLATNPNIGSFMIKNSFFYKEKYDFKGLMLNETQAIKDLNLHMMALVWRENKVWKYNHRSKFILMPKRVNNIGIHRVYGHLKTFREVVVDPNVAILHHYRGSKPLKNNETLRDDSARKYNKQLIEKVKRVYHDTNT